MDETINKSKKDLIYEIECRVEDIIIEKSNADLIIRLINNADSLLEKISITRLETTYKKKVDKLRKCYLVAISLTSQILYLSKLRNDVWNIIQFKDGNETRLTKEQFEGLFS